MNILTPEVLQIEHLISETNESLTHLINKRSVISRSIDRVRKAKAYKILSRKRFIVDIFNQALAIVFPDTLYTIDIEIDETDTGNLKYKLVLYKNGIEIASNANVFKSTGGGIITVLSFVLKILFFVSTGNKFYILDEVFSQISDEYRPRIMTLLKLLVDRYGFTFFIISHEGLENHEYVDIVYKASKGYDSNGIPRLQLETVYSNNVEYENTIHVHIENFQSIETVDIDIKGITVLVGPSDVGKSAIQRAIRSVVVNDFDSNTYPRNLSHIKRNKPPTIIRLTKGDLFISLKYQKNQVVYETHEGTFTGKKLSEGSIYPILNSMGFVTPDKMILSKFTGDIKNQLSRIFITTQFDKLFFPEDRTGIEKILTLLFDTQIFFDLESEIKKDLLSCNSQIKETSYQIKELEKKRIEAILEGIENITQLTLNTQKLRKKSESLSKRYKQGSHLLDTLKNIIQVLTKQNLIYSATNVFQKQKSLTIEKKLLETTLAIIIMKKLILMREKIQISSKLTKLLTINIGITILTVTKLYSEKRNILQNLMRFNEIKRSINEIGYHIVKVKNLQNLKLSKDITYIKKHTYVLGIESLLTKKIQALIQERNDIMLTKEQLTSVSIEDKYGLQVCECCKGLGYQIRR